jgi:beta-phosphoglucomutase-like phosphatase (HAD superfamily)
VVELWRQRQPWTGSTVDEVTARIVNGVADHVRVEGVGMDGAVAAFDTVRGAGLLCAVASSSPPVLISAALERLGIRDAVDAACSAVDDAHGKPAPDIYLRTAAVLGVSPSSCLAVEDSVAGVLSARAAGMTCVAIPDTVTAEDPRLAASTTRLRSLLDLDATRLGELRSTYFA